MLRYLCLLLACVPALVSGHGMLIQPPARGTAWRYGHGTPINYSDNELNCGGYENQWIKQGGKCGVCGDKYQGPRYHEPNGKYYGGKIVATYQEGEIVNIGVRITTNHLGYFEYHLCVHNDWENAATEECFTQNLLELADGSGTRIPIAKDDVMVYAKFQLPKGVTCKQCVLRWRYTTGNSWGSDNSGDGVGHGQQEMFYGCSDITIE